MVDRQAGEQKIQEIIQKIVQEYQPEKIILFGSWAWGHPGEDSDIDLLIVKKSEKRRIDREREVGSMLSGNCIPVDILVYTPEELETSIHQNRNLFIEDIVHNGTMLYSRSDDMIRVVRQRPFKVLAP